MTTTLYRATAYRRRAWTAPDPNEPDCHVFIEAADAESAAQRLRQALALLWQCPAAEVEHYNLLDETALLGSGGVAPREMGDAGLLCSGWLHGPLFCQADRVLPLVRPRTLQRLARARRLAQPWQHHQREAALLAARQRHERDRGLVPQQEG